MIVIGRPGKQGAGHFRPMVGRGNAQLFLAVEMVEETALGDARLGTDIVDPGRAIALGPYDGEGRIQKPGL